MAEDPEMPAFTIYKTAREPKTVGFDFSNTGPVVAGEVLSDPLMHIPASANVVAAGLMVLEATFVDAGKDTKKRPPIPAGKGTKVQLQGGTPGIYRISCSCKATPSNDRPEVVGRLVITTAPG